MIICLEVLFGEFQVPTYENLGDPQSILQVIVFMYLYKLSLTLVGILLNM
jgi:hypothetical protein